MKSKNKDLHINEKLEVNNNRELELTLEVTSNINGKCKIMKGVWSIGKEDQSWLIENGFEI